MFTVLPKLKVSREVIYWTKNQQEECSKKKEKKNRLFSDNSLIQKISAKNDNLISSNIIACNWEMKFQFTSGWFIGQQCLTHHFENKFKIPQGGLQQFVILRTFTHISRSCSIPWVKLRTQQLLESSLPCQTLIPAQNLTYIKQTISRITLINLVIGRMEGNEAAWWKRSERKIKSVFHFLLNLWGSLTLPLLYITVWWLYHTAVTRSSGLIHL